MCERCFNRSTHRVLGVTAYNRVDRMFNLCLACVQKMVDSEEIESLGLRLHIRELTRLNLED